MKCINFMCLTKDIEIKEVLNYAWSCGFAYEQVKEEVEALKYTLPEEQWKAYEKVLDIQCYMVIGDNNDQR